MARDDQFNHSVGFDYVKKFNDTFERLRQSSNKRLTKVDAVKALISYFEANPSEIFEGFETDQELAHGADRHPFDRVESMISAVYAPFQNLDFGDFLKTDSAILFLLTDLSHFLKLKQHLYGLCERFHAGLPTTLILPFELSAKRPLEIPASLAVGLQTLFIHMKAVCDSATRYTTEFTDAGKERFHILPVDERFRALPEFLFADRNRIAYSLPRDIHPDVALEFSYSAEEFDFLVEWLSRAAATVGLRAKGDLFARYLADRNLLGV